MKNNIFEYKGYHTKIEFDAEDLILRGKIEGISDLVNFECESMQDVEKEFHAAVDDYLAFCEEVGKIPEKEYKGTFNVRISPDLHRKLAMYASKNGETLNSAVESAIAEYVQGGKQELLRTSIDQLTEVINSTPAYTNTGKIGHNSNIIYPNFTANCVMSYGDNKKEALS